MDILYELLKYKIMKKPKTYRKIVRKDYLEVANKNGIPGNRKGKPLKKTLVSQKKPILHLTANRVKSVPEESH